MLAQNVHKYHSKFPKYEYVFEILSRIHIREIRQAIAHVIIYHVIVSIPPIMLFSPLLFLFLRLTFYIFGQAGLRF